MAIWLRRAQQFPIENCTSWQLNMINRMVFNINASPSKWPITLSQPLSLKAIIRIACRFFNGLYSFHISFSIKNFARNAYFRGEHTQIALNILCNKTLTIGNCDHTVAQSTWQISAKVQHCLDTESETTTIYVIMTLFSPFVVVVMFSSSPLQDLSSLMKSAPTV